MSGAVRLDIDLDADRLLAAGLFTALLLGKGIKISMDGKGAWRDNVFLELPDIQNTFQKD